jgi:ubiquinone/menaquinone biosynthesis C-methylase UbiE
MGGTIHEAARVGFDVAADAYERGRPDYPAEAVRHVVRALGIRPGARVLDLAAGTGKFTRQLVATAARIVAVEPVEGMRRTFAAVLPGIPVVAGRAEAIPLSDGSFDAAVVAQAFHWFDAPVAGAELHRVLRPGRGLALVWNVRDESFSFWAAITELLKPYEADAPRHRWKAWLRALDETELFEPIGLRSFPYQQRLCREALFDRVLSTSFIAALKDDEKARFRRRLGELIEEDPGTAGRQEIVLPDRTDVYTTVRRN